MTGKEEARSSRAVGPRLHNISGKSSRSQSCRVQQLAEQTGM